MTASQAIFLSYASQDADAARRICDAMRAAGLEVWFDQSELRGGDAWDASIRKQIKECALFVPMISASTNARSEGYFRLEWKLAVDRSHLMADDQPFFLPVILDDTPEPAARVPDKFRERQWSRLNDDAAFAAFAGRIGKLIAGSGVSATNAPNAAPNGDVGTRTNDCRPRESGDPVAFASDKEKTLGPRLRGDDRIESSGTIVNATPLTKDATPSIAVLAFANRSASADDEYFSDGLADELLNVLAKIKGLRVIARTSSFAFKGKSDDAATIGAKLNVATLLEGSVRKSGNRVRISVQLVKTDDASHLWSETYDRTLDDIFAVQDDIAQSVVKELRTKLLTGSREASVMANAMHEAAALGRTGNTEAYRLWLQGKHLFKRSEPRDRKMAVEYFTRATELDPQYAAAWASLAHAIYWHTGSSGAEYRIDDYVSGYRSALAAANRAIALEPNLAEAHIALAYIHGSASWDASLGEASARRALALAPNDAEVLYHTGLHLTVHRHFDEALSLADRAIALDPLNHLADTLRGRIYYYLDRFEEAEAALRAGMKLNPTRWGREFLWRICIHTGRIDEARKIAVSEPLAEYRMLGECAVAWATGDRLTSDALLTTATEQYARFFAWQLAQIHAFRGEADKVFEWAEACYAQHDPGIHWILADPYFRPYYNDPRWKPMLRKIGFSV